MWHPILVLMTVASPGLSDAAADNEPSPFGTDAFLAPTKADEARPSVVSEGQTDKSRITVGAFLVQKKVMPQFRLYFVNGKWLSMIFGATFLASTHYDKLTDQGGFLGNLFEVHLGAYHRFFDRVSIAASTGLDYYSLWAINLDEAKLGLPLVAEVQATLVGRFGVYAQARWYLLKSSGLEPGERVNGDKTAPLLVSVGGTLASW
jgi:hypothetical protein